MSAGSPHAPDVPSSLLSTLALPLNPVRVAHRMEWDGTLEDIHEAMSTCPSDDEVDSVT